MEISVPRTRSKGMLPALTAGRTICPGVLETSPSALISPCPRARDGFQSPGLRRQTAASSPRSMGNLRRTGLLDAGRSADFLIRLARLGVPDSHALSIRPDCTASTNNPPLPRTDSTRLHQQQREVILAHLAQSHVCNPGSSAE